MALTYPIVASPALSSNLGTMPRCDVAVIGGGVVGCATARRLALSGAHVVVLEKAADILEGASKGNSALLHTGFDAPMGSLELSLMQRGYAEYLAIREGLGLPLLETGAMVAAWTADEESALTAILAQAHANGVADARLITKAEAHAREPHLAQNLRAALLVPGEHVIDAWSAPLAYLVQAIAHGAALWRNAEVASAVFDGRSWRIDTAAGPLVAGAVVNCAGLYGDIVEQRCLGDASFTIRPRKGQFVVFDKPASRLFTSIILPVPSERSKGVVLCRTIYGNALIGPTAEDQPERDRATVEQSALQALIARATDILPGLRGMPVNAVYAGLRPATERKGYRIRHEPERHWLTLGGIRSTGLTAALGLGAYAAELLGFEESAPPRPATVPMLAEEGRRDWQRPGYGEIVCHCEMVTRREIEAVFASPVPPTTRGGLKRRTRATMGRCQGFYCGARIQQILQDHGHG
jgi:glycerol-3-phosphate dehydrogenase